ncbi:MAG: hypothetical protein ACXW2E_01815 [Nitrososphaeraceae archaeon]
MYIIYKESYDDFDVPVLTPIGYNSDKGAAQAVANARNENRTDEEVNDCIKYIVSDKLKLLTK